jgi:gliding motility-associated-like protein
MRRGGHKVFYLIFTGLFVLLGQLATAQVERQATNHWYFGNGYGMNFSSGVPVVDNSSAIFSYEASTSMSDKEGNLLFYSNAGGRVDSSVFGYIWNRNHEVMQGGELGALEGGGYSATQGAISIRKPGSDSLYYMFTIDELETLQQDYNPFPQGRGLSYFEIDMSADGGLGAVNQRNIKLLTPAFEHLSATSHANCEDYWILARTGHGFVANDPSIPDSFYVFRLSSEGVQNPVITPIPDGVECAVWQGGLIRFSPDGNRVLCGDYLFDFDKSTGELGDYVNLKSSIGITALFPIAFSPNSRFLYYFTIVNEGLNNASLLSFYCIQYDLENPSLFGGSTIIYSSLAPGPTLNGTAQIGPDGKIYLPYHYGNQNEATRVFVIESPNVKGVEANFHGPVMELSQPSNQPFLRFGNYTDNLLYYDTIENLVLDLPDQVFIDCENVTEVTINNLSDFPCQLWSDGSTGSTIEVIEEGTYWVEVADGCAVGRDTFEVLYENGIFEANLGADTTICEGADVLLFPDPVEDAIYLWSDGSDFPYLYTDTTGTYWVEIRIGNCYARDTLVVDQYFGNIFAADTSICDGEVLTLAPTASEGSDFSWSDGSTGSTLAVESSGIYWVNIEQEGCLGTDTIGVEVIPEPLVELGSDTIICAGDELVLNASGVYNNTFLWVNGNTDSLQPVNRPGYFRVTVSNDCGIISDEINVDTVWCYECEIKFPNVFTPEESTNQTFGAESNCDFESYSLQIFNRWGSVVFVGRTFADRWDGYSQGIPSPADTYFYQIEYTRVNPLGEIERGSDAGDVTLIR